MPLPDFASCELAIGVRRRTRGNSQSLLSFRLVHQPNAVQRLSVPVMLSSRPQHALFVDKENVLGNAPSRKGSALSASSQNLLKTPSVKQQPLGGAKTVKATSSKQAMGTTHVRSHKNSGAATIALEPGARVLSVKDSNNRSGLMARASQQGGKDKGKRLDTVYDDCSLMRRSPSHLATFLPVIADKHWKYSFDHPGRNCVKQLANYCQV